MATSLPYYMIRLNAPFLANPNIFIGTLQEQCWYHSTYLRWDPPISRRQRHSNSCHKKCRRFPVLGWAISLGRQLRDGRQFDDGRLERVRSKLPGVEPRLCTAYTTALFVVEKVCLYFYMVCSSVHSFTHYQSAGTRRGRTN